MPNSSFVRLARGASPWLAPAVATAVAGLVCARGPKHAWAIAVPTTALAAGALWSFRGPEDEIAQGQKTIAGATRLDRC